VGKMQGSWIQYGVLSQVAGFVTTKKNSSRRRDSLFGFLYKSFFPPFCPPLLLSPSFFLFPLLPPLFVFFSPPPPFFFSPPPPPFFPPLKHLLRHRFFVFPGLLFIALISPAARFLSSMCHACMFTSNNLTLFARGDCMREFLNFHG